jgi:hypothetical protein
MDMDILQEIGQTGLTLLDVTTTLSVYGYRAANYNGTGVWRILGEIAATYAHADISYFYYSSSEKDYEDFVRVFDRWRKGA